MKHWLFLFLLMPYTHLKKNRHTHKHILKHPHKEKKINGSEIITIEENGML